MHLGGCNLGDEEAKALAQLLTDRVPLPQLAVMAGTSYQSTLLSLNLEVNCIGVEGIAHLAEALKTNTCLCSLKLGRNKIGVEGAKQLASSLVVNSSLTMLTLGGCGIEADGACALAKTLEQNTGIVELRLGCNNICDIGACAFAQMMRSNRKIQRLHLYANHITEVGIESFRAYMQTSLAALRVKVLNLGGNDCEPSAWVELGEMARLHSCKEFRERVAVVMLLWKSGGGGFATLSGSGAPEQYKKGDEDMHWWLAYVLYSLHRKYVEEGYGKIRF